MRNTVSTVLRLAVQDTRASDQQPIHLHILCIHSSSQLSFHGQLVQVPRHESGRGDFFELNPLFVTNIGYPDARMVSKVIGQQSLRDVSSVEPIGILGKEAGCRRHGSTGGMALSEAWLYRRHGSTGGMALSEIVRGMARFVS